MLKGFKSGGFVRPEDAKPDPDTVSARLSPADERWLRPGERWVKREGSAIDNEMAKLVERQRPAGGWRPIEYYDGSFAVLLYDRNVGPFVGGKDGSGWYICGYETQYHNEDLKPTHWADLPASP